MVFTYGKCGHPLFARFDVRPGTIERVQMTPHTCRVCPLLAKASQWVRDDSFYDDDETEGEIPWSMLRERAARKWRGREDEANAYQDQRRGWPTNHHNARDLSDAYMASLESMRRRDHTVSLRPVEAGAEIVSVALYISGMMFNRFPAGRASACADADSRVGHTSRDVEAIGALPGLRYDPETGEPRRAYLRPPFTIEQAMAALYEPHQQLIAASVERMEDDLVSLFAGFSDPSPHHQ